MDSREIRGNWSHVKDAVRDYWKRLTDDDVAAIAGERDQLMQRIKARYGKTYGEIDREVIEFEFRDVRAANASRLSLGIQNDQS